MSLLSVDTLSFILSNGTQKIKINNYFSFWHEIEYDAP